MGDMVESAPADLAATVLVVDLDGTLLQSDMLHESFWSAFGRNWRSPFLAMAALMQGRAALKAYLQGQARVDVATLPYNPAVLDRIAAHRALGGRVALVTAANTALAEQIAAYLQLFDEVHGSDAVTNLKGQAKAAFLCQRFGAGGFVYMGDAKADLPVWAVASQVITVNAPARLRSQAQGLGKPTLHLGGAARGGWTYLAVLRPHQWLKNVLVFLPMLASHQLGLATFMHSFVAFVAFCLVASSVYVLNDLLDLGADRAHPRKRLRPFAAGAVPLAQGAGMAVGLALAGAAVAACLCPAFALVLGVYYLLATAYSLVLKRQIVLDICVLAGLYTMRLIAGAVASGIDLSVWLLAFSTFFFFALAAVKRQAELVSMAERGALAARGRGYNVQDLPIISMVGLAAGYISVLVMALYVNAPPVQELYANPHALWGICAVLLYWLTRIVLLTHRGAMPDDPVVFAAKDRVSLVCLALILAFTAGGALL